MKKRMVCVSLLLCILLLTACAQEMPPVSADPVPPEATEPAIMPPPPQPDAITWVPSKYPELSDDLPVIRQSVKDAIKTPLSYTQQATNK